MLATPVLAAEPAMDEAARMQYALGYQLGRDLVAIEPRPQDLLKGVEDGRAGGKTKLSDEEMGAALAALQQKVGAQREKDQAAASEKAAAAGKAYLAANAGKSGVITTASGLQYQILTAGTGKTPAAATPSPCITRARSSTAPSSTAPTSAASRRRSRLRA